MKARKLEEPVDSVTRAVPVRGLESGGLDLGLDQVVQFLRLLWSLDHELRLASKRMEARHGVTGRQRFALRMAGHAPGLAASELARLLQIDPSTLTGILSRLESDGLLKRSMDKDDSRRVRLKLTAAGRRVDALNVGTVESAVRQALEGCDREEIAGAKAVLNALQSELRKLTIDDE